MMDRSDLTRALFAEDENVWLQALATANETLALTELLDTLLGACTDAVESQKSISGFQTYDVQGETQIEARLADALLQLSSQMPEFLTRIQAQLAGSDDERTRLLLCALCQGLKQGLKKGLEEVSVIEALLLNVLADSDSPAQETLVEELLLSRPASLALTQGLLNLASDESQMDSDFRANALYCAALQKKAHSEVLALARQWQHSSSRDLAQTAAVILQMQ